MRRLALLLLLAAGPAALAQVPTDTSQTVPPAPAGPDPEANEPDAGDPGAIRDGSVVDVGQIRVRPRLSPSALYSSNRGFGIGGGVAADNLGWRGSRSAVDLRVQQHFLGAGVSVATSDPYDRIVYGIVSAEASTTDRRQFYGVGPFVSGSLPLQFVHSDFSVDARAGVYPFGTTALLVQPGVRYVVDRTSSLRDDSPAGLGDLTPESRASVEPVLDVVRRGVSAGVEVAVDFRDWPGYPHSGSLVAVEARRFGALDDSDLRFNRYSLQTVSYVPIRGRTALIASVTGIVTRQDDRDGDGTPDPLPYYYLPTLDDRVAVAYKQDRLTARDVFAVSLGVRVPIRDFIGVYGIDALVVGYLGNAYDDVVDQFSPRVSFSQNSRPDADGRAPLLPALGLGLGVVNLDKERVVLGALVGVGAGGITLATLRVAYNLRDSRPLFR